MILGCLKPAPEDRPADAALVFSGLQKKPMRKAPLLALLLVVSAGLAVPQVRGWLRDLIWPPPSVRLAVLPFEGSADTAEMAGGVLQDVSDRIGHLRSGRRAVAVISPSEAVSSNVQTPEQANQVLHATHALQTKVHREGGDLALQASGAIDRAMTWLLGVAASGSVGPRPGQRPSVLYTTDVIDTIWKYRQYGQGAGAILQNYR